MLSAFRRSAERRSATVIDELAVVLRQSESSTLQVARLVNAAVKQRHDALKLIDPRQSDQPRGTTARARPDRRNAPAEPEGIIEAMIVVRLPLRDVFTLSHRLARRCLQP